MTFYDNLHDDRPTLPHIAHPHVTTQDAPYRPVFILVMGMCLSAIAAGFLTAINWRRLGQAQHAMPLILFNVVVVPLVFVAATAAMGMAGLWIGWIGGWLLTIYYAETQRHAYEAWVASHDNVPPTLAQSGYNGLEVAVFGVVLLFGLSVWVAALATL